MMENQTSSSRLYEMLCLSRLTYAVVKVLLTLIKIGLSAYLVESSISSTVLGMS